MILGLTLILIVLIPLCIYLYITNNALKIKVKNLQTENKIILERKVLKSEENDILPISNIETEKEEKLFVKEKNISPKEEIKKESISIKNEHCRSGVPIIKQDAFNINDFYNKKEKNITLPTITKTKENQINAKKFIFEEYEEPELFIKNLKDFRNNLKP